MSIFTKLSILFCLSITLMLYLSIKTDAITQEKIQYIHQEKYIQASKEFLNFLANGDFAGLNQRTKELNYSKLSKAPTYDKTIYTDTISFGTIKIVKNDTNYFLYINYLDDAVWFYDNSQKKEHEQKELLNYLIVADIIILIIMFLIIIKILNPLKKLSNVIENFGAGDFSVRLKPTKQKDEISKLINTFNAMAQNLQNLITSRVQFLNDISHELRTPISKAKISLEMIEHSRYKEILKKSINHIDELTNELLEIEKLNADTTTLNLQTHSIDTILALALSKMQVEDEESIDVKIIELYQTKADINYLAIAIKNLIDNALKYKEKDKVEIVIKHNLLEIKNYAKPLSKDLKYYTQTFTQENSARNTSGYGLGLNLVKRILERHNFNLIYSYNQSKICFTIQF